MRKCGSGLWKLWGAVLLDPALEPFLSPQMLPKLHSAARRRARLGNRHRSSGVDGEAVTALLEAVTRVSGLNLVIDSTKHAGGLALLQSRGFDVRPVHLVRDPRAVVNADLRSVGSNGVERPPGRTFLPSIAHWIWTNLACAVASRRSPHRARVGYERLVADPEAILADLSIRLDLPVDTGEPGRLVHALSRPRRQSR